MLSRLFSRSTEERAVSYQSLWGAGETFAFTTNAGVVINQEDSLKIGTVYACVRLIADSISTLPVDTFIRVDGDRRPFRPRPEWLDMPEVGVSRTDHFQQVLVSMLLNGNSFTRIIRDNAGVAGLTVLNPLKVEIKRDNARRLIYVYDSKEIIDHTDMIHLSELRLPGELRGKSRIDLVKENLGLSKALEEFAARFFGQGSHTSGIIEYPNNLTREQAKSLVDGFEEGHKGLRQSHRPGILFGGAKYTQTSVAPDDSQFLQSRQFAVEEILRAFRVPPSMAGVLQPGAQAYASVEMNGIHFVMHTLRPYVTKIEDGYAKLLDSRAFLKFNLDGLMRGDFGSRVAGYSSALQAGWMSINDVRRFEDLRPADGGDTYRVPLANVDLAASNLTELDRKTSMAQRLINSGFEPAAVLKALMIDPIKHTGVAPTMLQPVTDPAASYDVNQRDVNVNMPEILVNVPPAQVSVAAPIINVPETVVRVNIPENRPTVRTVERDADGRILTITERSED
ncbi:MAG: phage portal protein [Microbacteriaceae bacterium]|nr:phage portal protein [Microbacteriaceae bacterium]